jgi:hypothetical protein
MPWGKIDDQFYDHPKLDTLGSDRLACAGLYWIAISFCNRHLTDGFVPEDRMIRLADKPRREALRLASRLVDAGLWEAAEGGYRIHDFLEEGRNKSREQVEEERAGARRRQAELRARQTAMSQRDIQTQSQGEFAAPVPSRPITRPSNPSPTPPKGSGSNDRQSTLRVQGKPQSVGEILRRVAQQS